MAAASGIWNQAQAMSTPFGGATHSTSSTQGNSSQTSGSATISANDFLTLLVTEMQNQDPTADTDPNEYINQLVNVNSLEQLIGINQTLTAMDGSGSTQQGSSGHRESSSASIEPLVSHGHARAGSVAASGSSPNALDRSHGQGIAGNLSIPAENRSAQRVAQSLTGR